MTLNGKVYILFGAAVLVFLEWLPGRFALPLGPLEFRHNFWIIQVFSFLLVSAPIRINRWSIKTAVGIIVCGIFCGLLAYAILGLDRVDWKTGNFESAIEKSGGWINVVSTWFALSVVSGCGIISLLIRYFLWRFVSGMRREK